MSSQSWRQWYICNGLGLVYVLPVLQNSNQEPVWSIFYLFHYLGVFVLLVENPILGLSFQWTHSWWSAHFSVSILLFYILITSLPSCLTKIFDIFLAMVLWIMEVLTYTSNWAWCVTGLSQLGTAGIGIEESFVPSFYISACFCNRQSWFSGLYFGCWFTNLWRGSMLIAT